MLGISLTLRTSACLAGAIIIGTYVIFGGPGDSRKKRRRKDIIPGLANVGNSCFLNALVQSLASCPLFINWLTSKLRDPSPPLVTALHDLLKVLNNDGGHGGDACAGEVMRALRAHGWVISAEEQDTHELFHALTATLDEELGNVLTTPSLLDVSWMEESETNIYEEGVLLKAASVEYLNRDYSIKKMNGVEVNGNTECAAMDNSYMKGGENVDKSDSFPSTDMTVANQNCDNFSLGKNDSAKNGAEGNTNGSNSHERNPGCDSESCKYQKYVDSKNDTDNIYVNGEHSQGNIHNGKIISAKESSEISNLSSQVEDCTNHSFESNKPSDRKNNDEPDRGSVIPPTIPRREDLEKATVDRYWKTRPDQQDSPFRGYLASQLQCILCGHKNPAQWSSFESISLSLPSVPWGEVTLQELLDCYITQEKVTDVTCDNCTKKAGCTIKTSFTKQLTIGKLPECLCFHVKRTIWLENGTAIKRRDHVIFPEFLTMDPYTYTTSITTQGQRDSLRDSSDHSHPTSERNGGANLSTDWSANSYDHQSLSILSKHATSSQLEPSSFVHVSRVRCEQLYRLKAVIVHVGDVFCGHFVTYRRGAIGSRTRNRWFYASDLLVREASLEEVKKAHIYMILYEKVTQ